jgi:hypothetical protein
LSAAFASGLQCMGWTRRILARKDGIAVPVRILAEKFELCLPVIENALDEERSRNQAIQKQERGCPPKEAFTEEATIR